MLAIHAGKLSESCSRAVSIIYNLQNIRENMYLELSKAVKKLPRAVGKLSVIPQQYKN
jgi:hypothetical protein